MIIALEIAIDVDLADFSALLRSRGVNHRISESGNHQLVWVQGDAEKQQVETLFDAFQQGILSSPAATQQKAGFKGNGGSLMKVMSYVFQYPVTLVFLVLSLLLFPLGMDFGPGREYQLLSKLTFVDFKVIGFEPYFDDVTAGLQKGEYWRLLTPMFIHFSWLHLVFNMLWLWEIGRRVEVVNGKLVLLVLILTASLASNFGQYLLTGPGLFGGMSGVVFGLLGHSLVWKRSMGLPTGVYVFMLVYLALGFTGAIDLLGQGSIANGAHLGGLITGVISGLLCSLHANYPKNSTS